MATPSTVRDDPAAIRSELELAVPHTLSDAVKLAGLVLSLGFDTFAVALGLGISKLDRRERLRFGTAFALAEGLMPLVGFSLGQGFAAAAGGFASSLAIALLFAVGLYMLWEALRGADRAYQSARLPVLIFTALSVSLDELAIGFSLGLLHVPVILAAALIAAQAFILTVVGMAVGRRAGEVFAEGAEVLSGAVLTLLAVFLLIEKLR